MSPCLRSIAAARLQHTLQILLIASGFCCLLGGVRWYYARELQFSVLMGNLLLAWIPALLALLILWEPLAKRPVLFWLTGALWLLFYPNAFYLVTDLIHMKKFGSHGVYRWLDMLMVSSFAWVGAFLGILSLYTLHLRIHARRGSRAGWLFAVAVQALAAFGIFLGRELRVNSWDVFTRLPSVWRDVTALLAPERSRPAAAFTLVFFLFSMMCYGIALSMAQLHEAAPASASGKAGAPGRS